MLSKSLTGEEIARELISFCLLHMESSLVLSLELGHPLIMWPCRRLK